MIWQKNYSSDTKCSKCWFDNAVCCMGGKGLVKRKYQLMTSILPTSAMLGGFLEAPNLHPKSGKAKQILPSGSLMF